MREINLNGYIDDEVWFGDEITPDSLHETLYEPGMDQSEDVHIRLNSYGGSCNAAVRMHDDLVAYPGSQSCAVPGWRPGVQVPGQGFQRQTAHDALQCVSMGDLAGF